MILPNTYSMFLSFLIVFIECILPFSISKYRIQKIILDTYLNTKYSNYKTYFILICVFRKYKFRNNTEQALDFLFFIQFLFFPFKEQYNPSRLYKLYPIGFEAKFESNLYLFGSNLFESDPMPAPS